MRDRDSRGSLETADANGTLNEAAHLAAVETRRSWIRAWSALPRERIIAEAVAWAEAGTVRFTEPAAAGLLMMRMRDGVAGEPFNLGEIPISTAQVRLVEPASGKDVAGAAQVMADDEGLATALAILDALLANNLPGAAKADAMRREGAAIVARTDADRAAMRAATRVDFRLLDDDAQDQATS